MIIVGDTLLSEDILEQHFVCNLGQCRGSCCISGDQGAPLDKEELAEIANNLEVIKPYMSEKGLGLLESRGFYEQDPKDGDWVTTCSEDGACVFVNFEQGIARCAIENAYRDHKTGFIKPVSCHLYPIRMARYGEYHVMNYHRWDICQPACAYGKELQVKIFEFLKEPLIRKMGPEWYASLEEASKDWNAAHPEK